VNTNKESTMRYLSPPALGRILGTSPCPIIDRIEEGVLHATRMPSKSGRGHYRIRLEDAAAFALAAGFDISDKLDVEARPLVQSAAMAKRRAR
jgi:hypothetical protein